MDLLWIVNNIHTPKVSYTCFLYIHISAVSIIPKDTMCALFRRFLCTINLEHIIIYNNEVLFACIRHSNHKRECNSSGNFLQNIINVSVSWSSLSLYLTRDYKALWLSIHTGCIDNNLLRTLKQDFIQMLKCIHLAIDHQLTYLWEGRCEDFGREHVPHSLHLFLQV